MKKKSHVLILCALSYNPIINSLQEEPAQTEYESSSQNTPQEDPQALHDQEVAQAEHQADHNNYTNQKRHDLINREKEKIPSKKTINNQNSIVLDPNPTITPNNNDDVVKKKAANNVKEAIKTNDQISDQFESELKNEQKKPQTTDEQKKQIINERGAKIIKRLPSVEKSVFKELFDAFLDLFDSGDVSNAKEALKRAKKLKDSARALRNLSETQRINVINNVIIESVPKNSLFNPAPTESMKIALKEINSILPAKEQVKFRGYKIVKA